MTQMKFDFDKITTEQVQPLIPGLNQARMVAMAKMVALFAVDCPPEWGKPDVPETYSTKPFREVLAYAWKEFGEANKALEATVEGVEFDLEQVTPEEYDALTRDLNSNIPEKMAAVLAKFVKKCPKAWGDPSKRETYLKLNYYKQFLPLARALSKAGSTELENFLKLLTSD